MERLSGSVSPGRSYKAEKRVKHGLGGMHSVVGLALLIPALARGASPTPALQESLFVQTETAPAAAGAGQLSAASAEPEERPWFFRRLFNAYVDEFNPPPAIASTDPEPVRRALPAPWDSPPYPGSEYQGSPLIGVPVSTKE